METYTTRILLVLFSLVTSVLVSRLLGPAGRGVYAVAAAIGAIGVQFCNLGVHSSNTYYVARDRSLLPELLGNTLAVGLVGASVGAALVWLLFAARPALAPLHGPLLLLGLIWVPIGLTYMLMQNLLLGLQAVRAYNVIELSAKAMTVALLGLVVWIQPVTPEKVFFATLLGAAVAAVLAYGRLRPLLAAPLRLSLPLFRSSFSYGFRAYAAALFGFLLLRVDLLMVQYMQGPEQAGYYSISASMADLVYMFPAVVAAILFPRLTALDDGRLRWRRAQQATLVVGAATLGLALLAALLARPAVQLLYGREFLPAVPSFLILAAAMVFYGANNIISQYLASVGFPWFAVGVWALACLVNVVLNLFLIPARGISGAAFASLIGYSLVLILQYAYVLRRLQAGAAQP